MGIPGLTGRHLQALHDAVHALPGPERSKGNSYYVQHRVGKLSALVYPDDPDIIGFEARVQGSEPYTVTWEYLPAEGWVSSCTCPVEMGCKHAAAAAIAVLKGKGVDSPHPGDGPAGAAGAPSSEAARLIALLEEKHGRRLAKAEVNFVRKLERVWQRHRTYGTIYLQELAEVNLADRGSGLYYDPNPAIHQWWDEPLESLLELWQYLAHFAERANRPLPPLMKPVTDTAAVRARVVAVERRRQVKHWSELFRHLEETPPEPAIVPVAGDVPELRIRLARPKLLWEQRAEPDGPWRAVKGGQIKEWFAIAQASPANIPPATLALLQEVQLRRLRPRVHGYGWGTSTEPQTLRIDDDSTTEFVRWILASGALQGSFVNEAGQPYDSDPVTLVWSAHPAAAGADDVDFEVTLPDGAPLPPHLWRLPGDPPLGLAGTTVYQFPPLLPGSTNGGAIRVPREALQSTAAVRQLRRARVVPREGADLPVTELVPLRPRFVCHLVEDLGRGGFGARHGLEVELQARSADGALVQVWDGTAWTSLAGHGIAALPRQAGLVPDLDCTAADAARPLLSELRVVWSGSERRWTRTTQAKNFPEEFAEWTERVRKAGIELECDPLLAGLTRAPDRARVEMEVSADEAGGSGIDWFDLKLVVRAEDATLSTEEIALLLKARGRFVLLKDKGWRRLQLEVDAEQQKRLGELGLDPGVLEGAPQRQRFHALQLADERIAGLLPEQHAAQVRERVERLQAIAPPPIPADLTAVLRPYQQEGFHFLAHLSSNGLGGVLADDMGLGKTVQALAWLLWLAKEQEGKAPLLALVVCPKSVVTNWVLEAGRFAPSLTTAIFHARAGGVPAVHLVVANYAQLRLAADTLGAVRWDAVILDEGQNIKNPQSQTAQVARNLPARHRIVLTGTPIENRVLDLWSLFAFAMPGLLGGQTAFKRTFNDRTDPLARARLGRRVRHFMLRRTKGQVASELPPRIEEDIVVELDAGQRRLYDAELKRTRQMLLGVETARQFDEQRFNILQSLLRLRQICCDPRLLNVGATSAESAKVAALFDQLEPILAEGHKVLVFSQFVSLLRLLQEELTERKIAFLTITGQTENRQDLVDQFQTSPEVSVFLLSLKAAGAGLNLTAASYVVLFDPWWNPAVEAQAIDRTHRIGQTNQVIAYRLIAKDTVEEKIRRLQQEKAALARAIVQEESLASVMNIDDLRYVLGD